MKKRFMSVLLIVCMLFTMIPAGFITMAAGSDILYGDANDSGKVELEDILLIERYISGEEVSINLKNADVNGDGVVDKIDSELIREYLVGNLSSLTPVLHTIGFNTDGADPIPPIQAGEGYPFRGEMPTPNKDGHFFVGWVLADGNTYFQNDHVIESDFVLTAVYEQMAVMQTLNITSFSLSDQLPSVGFDVTGDFDSAAKVKANLILVTKDGSDPVKIEVLDNGLNYTVFAPEGFKPGATYELTLGDGLTFVDKEEMIRTCYFIIAKDEADNLQHNNKVIFIKDTEEMKYTVGGTVYDVLAATLLGNGEGAEHIAGTFTMSGGSLAVGNIVCIYENIHPNDRDYTNDANHAYDNDAIAYIRITSVNGNVYGFESLNEDDIKDVLLLPDTIVYKMDTLPTANGSVNKQDYDTAARAALGQTTAPAFDIGDILVFYTGSFDAVISSNYSDVVYGQITSVSGNQVSYKIVTKEAIENLTGMFVYQQIDGQRIVDELTAKEKGQMLESIREQTLNSGFIEQAGDYMIKSALATEALQSRLRSNSASDGDIEDLMNTPNLMFAATSSSSGKPKLTVEGVSVTPTFIYAKRFNGGIGIKLEVCLTLSIDTMVTPTTKSSLKIELSAAFEEEIAVGFKVDVDDKWDGIILEELDVTVSVDIQNYTSVSVGAKIYTVGETEKQKWEALSDNYIGSKASPKTRDMIRQIDKLANKLDVLMKTGEPDEEGILDKIKALKNQLPKVEVGGVEYSVDQLEAALGAKDISSSFNEVFSAKTKPEAKVGLEQLMNRYTEMINQESQWVEVFNKELFEKEFHIKIIAIKISLNFIVRAHVNIALGADIEYEVGKRYTFWIHVFEKEAGSSEIDLLDERFGFQFYVMGTLGLKVGIKAELAVGIISTKIASVGANVEFGPYVKLYGYFVYIYQKLRPANTQSWNVSEEMLGALYIDFGLYITVNFKAQAFDDKFVYEPTLFDGEFPLLTVGTRQNVYDFSFHPDKKDILYIDDEDADSSTGITMSLPQVYRGMQTIDLVTGQKTQKTYSFDNYHVTFNDSRFSINNKGVINVHVPSTGVRYIQAEMRIVWKVDKLAFSKFDTDITVPVIWTNMTTTERSEKFNVSVAVGNLEEGYQTVWNDRYSRLDVFDLPTEQEILERILYPLYDDNGENLRYGEVIGYNDQSTGLSITSDRVFLFDISPKTYNITVKDVHHADGSVTDLTLKTQYGKSFNFDELKQTGKDNSAASEYTSFSNLLDKDGNMFDMSSIVNLEFIAKYGTNPEFTANYIDNAKTATCTFVGVVGVDPVTITFKSRTIPNLGDLNAYVREKAGEGAIIADISPVIERTEHSINYVVTCKLAEPAPVYYVIFDTKGGDPIKTHEYMKGSVLFPVEPTRTGYTFAGWYYAVDHTPFSFDGKLMPAHNLPLFATWTANTYTLTFDPGDYGEVTTQAQVYDQPIYQFPPSPTNDMFKFLGWYDGDGIKMQPGVLYQKASDQTFEGHWELKKTFNPDWIICNANQTSDYNKQVQAVSFSMASGYESLKSSIVVEYKQQGADTWTSSKPFNAGGYDVKFTRPSDGNYLDMGEKVVSGAVIIKRIPMVTGGGNLAAPAVYARGGSVAIGRPTGILGDGEISYILLKSDASRTYTNTTGFFTDLPAGTYIAYVSVAEGNNYLAATSNANSITVTGYQSGPYSAQIRIVTTDGTDAQITGGLYVRTPSGLKTKSHSTILDHGGNDFEAGDDHTYELGGGLVPWGITGGWIFKGSNKGVRPAWSFTSYLRIYGDGTKWSGWVNNYISGNEVGENVTLEKYDENFLRRNITTKVPLSDNIGNIDLAQTTNYSYSHDCTITDQFMNNYNPMDYVGSPIFSVTSGNPAYDSFIILTGMTSFEIDNKGLAEYLKLFGGEAPKYTISLEYPRNTVNNINNVDRNKIETVLLSTNIPAQAYQGANTGTQQTSFAMPMSLMLRSGTGAVNLLIDADDVVLNRGKEFEVPLTVSTDTPIWGVLAGVSFDISVLELTEVATGSIFSEEQFTLQRDLTTGTFRFLTTRTTLDTVVPAGTLITLRFLVRDDAEDKATEICIELLEAVNTVASVSVEKGVNMNVTIDNTAPILTGDINGKTFCEATEFIAVDENIDTVEVNGQSVEIVNNTFTVQPFDGISTIVLTDKAGNTTTVTITVNDGHTWTPGQITKPATYFEDGEQECACRVCGETKLVAIPKLIDTTSPAGNISIDTHNWNSFLNTVTFGLFFKETQTVSVSASDAESGVDKIYYSLSDRALSETEAENIADWAEFSDSFNIDPNNNHVVYVKITDKTGNSTIINTDGIVLDNIIPQISGVTDGAVYCEAVTVTVSDDNLHTVTLNGEEVSLNNGQVTVNPAAGEQTIIATDKSGNSTSVTITVNDGHTWDSGVVTVEPTAEKEGLITYTCTFCGVTKTEPIEKLPPSMTKGEGRSYRLGDGGTLIFRSNAAFEDFIHVTVDGDVLHPSHYNLSDGSIVIELKEEYLETLSAGTYTIGIVSTSGTASAEFTIEEKKQDDKAPKTGDNSNMYLWFALLFVSGGMAIALNIKSKKRRAVK